MRRGKFKQNGVTSFDSLFTEMQKVANKTVQADGGRVEKTAIKTLKDHVQTDVYDVYDPYLYEREGLLKERWKVENIKNGLAIMSDRYDGNKYVAQVVETGQGYTYNFPFDGVPRPFTQNAIDELINNNALTKALADDLISQGYKIEIK